MRIRETEETIEKVFVAIGRLFAESCKKCNALVLISHVLGVFQGHIGKYTLYGPQLHVQPSRQHLAAPVASQVIV